jgi:hypothetical protein
MGGNVNMGSNKVVFGDVLDDYKINLWGGVYGIGIRGSTLAFFSQGVHNFYSSTSPTNPVVSINATNGNINANGAITNGGNSYITAGGLRLGGFDTGNTIWNGNNNMGLTVNSGYAVNIGQNGGVGNALTVNNNGVSINNQTLTIVPNNTTRTAINMYCFPTGINNSNGNSNSVNLNVCCNTTGFATSSIINAVVADGWNGINTIVTLACSGGANSGYSNGSRMILDGSINTNSSRGAYASYIYWQSQTASGWMTNMELYTSGNPVISTVLNVFGSVRSNNVTLTSSENIKEKIRDIYDPSSELIDSFSGKHYYNKLTGEKDFGLIAEDVEKLCPCLITRYGDKEVDIGVKYMNLTAVLIEGIKELKKIVDKQGITIQTQQEQIDFLLSKIQ